MKCTIITNQNTAKTGDTKEKPTLVFDAGMGNWSLFFYPLAEELNGLATLCLLDRTGYTDRPAGPVPRDAHSIAREMKATLDANGITGPIILAGHSLGGLHVRMYQHLFPENVSGMILLDAAHPCLHSYLPGIKSKLESQIKQISNIKTIARSGLLKLAKKRIPTFGLPTHLHKQYYKVTTSASYYSVYQEEMEIFSVSLKQCRELKNPRHLPLLVISSPYGLNEPVNTHQATKIEKDRKWIELQADLCRISSDVTFIESTGDHFLHLSDTLTVSSAIRRFYSQITTEPQTSRTKISAAQK